MIKVTIENPSECYIENSVPDEIEVFKKELTYTDTGVMFNLKALNKNIWLRQNKPDIFEIRKKELESKLTTCMLKFKNGKYYFHPGSIPYMEDKVNFTVVNNVVYPEPKKIPWRKPLPFSLYNYQQESSDKLIEEKHGCVSLCTGSGKSLLLLNMTRELGLRTVIVTPSKSIFKEILEQFEFHFGKSKVGSFGAGKKVIGKQITVCISKSLSMVKKDTPEYKFFRDIQVLAVDESHLTPASTLEKVVHDLFKMTPYRFFVSGTQVRGDGKEKLLRSIIGKEVVSLNSRDAIEGGYICPVKFIIIDTFSRDPKNYRDPLKAKRKHLLYNGNVALLSAQIANSAWNSNKESTLILVEELCQIKAVSDLLNVPYGYAHSASKKDSEEYGLDKVKPHESVEAFNKGEIKVLIGTSCISTGTNMYPCHNTINWVGGASEVRTKQGAVGRSVRLLKNSKYKDLHKEKKISKIFDFNITNIERLKNHLEKRISMYKETSDDIVYIKETNG